MRRQSFRFHGLVRLVLGSALLVSSYAAVAEPFSRGATAVATTRTYTPKVEKAACFGWGPFCPPGWVRTCGFFACRCRPCF